MSNKNWIYSKRSVRMKSSVIRELLKVTKKPGVISFGGGLPAPELFPAKEISEIATKILKENPGNALQYGTTEGYPPLREGLAKRMKTIGVDCDPDQILITGGSQQGLDIIGRVFLDVGSPIITSRPTYLGAIQAFNAYNPEYLTLPSDENGMVVDGLEEMVKKNSPRIIYLVPTYQNPDGRTIPEDRRKEILRIAEEYNVPVIEDDPYSELCFEGSIPEHMISMAPENVILLGTFSKLLAPGLRIAWAITPKGYCYDRFVKMKQGMDLHTNTFGQHIIAEFLKTGVLDSHLKKIKEEYARRRNTMVECMHKYFPEDVTFTEPTGGLFLWVTLPEKINTTELLPTAVEKLVAYVPGSAFYPGGGGHNTMRLNYSFSSSEKIEEGIKRLGKLFKEAL